MEPSSQTHDEIRIMLTRAAGSDHVFSEFLKCDANPLIVTDQLKSEECDFFLPGVWKDGHVHNLLHSWSDVRHHVLVGFQVQNVWEVDRTISLQVVEVRIDGISVISDQSQQTSVNHILRHGIDDPVIFELARLRCSGKTQQQHGINLSDLLDRFPRSVERIIEQITDVSRVICSNPGTFKEV